MKKTIVIAGNYEQYAGYLRANNLSKQEHIYADSLERIKGLRGLSYVLVGEHWLNPVYANHPWVFEAYEHKEKD